jgi:hypothetical protein
MRELHEDEAAAVAGAETEGGCEYPLPERDDWYLEELLRRLRLQTASPAL